MSIPKDIVKMVDSLRNIAEASDGGGDGSDPVSINTLYELPRLLAGTKVKVRVERKDRDSKVRMILTSRSTATEIDRVCNGLVLSYCNRAPYWEVECVPACNFVYGRVSPRDKVKYTKAMKDAKFYKLCDGTIVTLYWYEDHWAVATTNAYEANHFQWMGEITYEKAITEAIMSHHGINTISFDRVTSTLDKSMCYTIGFRHHAFHPYKADPQKAWMISMRKVKDVVGEDGDGGEDKVESGDGDSDDAKQQGDKSWADITIDEDMAKKCLVTSLPTHEISVKNQNDLNRLFQRNRVNNKTLGRDHRSRKKVHGVEADEMWYGFVIRYNDSSDDGALALTPDIMYYSDTMIWLKKHIYHNLRNPKDKNSPVLDSQTRLQYAMIRTYMHKYSKNKAVKMFPQHKDMFDKLNDIMYQVVKRIIQALRNTLSRTELMEAATKITMDKAKKDGNDKLTMDQAVITLASSMIDDIDMHEINPMSRMVKSIVTDFVTSPRLTGTYHEIINKLE